MVSPGSTELLQTQPVHIVRTEIARLLDEVHDPEIPGLSIVDLGMVMDIRPKRHVWHIDLALTYSGCPAIDVIPFLVKAKLAEVGLTDVEIDMTIDPPWSTDWISETGRQKLLDYGIAPPQGPASQSYNEGQPRACPQCSSTDTILISRYGSTPCKAVYRCNTCLETFDYFKCY